MRSFKSGWKDARRRRLLERAGVAPVAVSDAFRAGARSGTWTVRRGGLDSGSTVVSAGVGDNIAWDLAMAREFGCAVHLLDPTPVACAWIADQDLPESVRFHALGLAAHDGTLALRPPRRTGGVNYRHAGPEDRAGRDDSIEVPCARLATFAAKQGFRRIDVLKLDIEGGEVDVLPDVLDSDLAIRQVLVEFHHRPDGTGFGETLDLVERLQRAGYGLFDVSRRGLEMSFARDSLD